MSEQLRAQAVARTPVLQAVRVGLSGRELKTMAQDGGFAVDETTGDRMIAALEHVIDSLTARWHALTKLQQSPPMSETAAARWVSTHMVNTAADEQGLLTQLQQAREEFPTYVEAIKLAKRNYQAREDETTLSLKRFNPEES